MESLCKSKDGFEIAQKDADMRGFGDFFGVRQSGGSGDLAKIDAELVVECRNLADKLYEEQRALALQNASVCKYLEELKDISLS